MTPTIVASLVLAFVLGVVVTWLIGRVTRQRADVVRGETELRGVVMPLKDALARVESTVRELERDRAFHYGQVAQRLDDVSDASERLVEETQNLVKALRTPVVRGAWGEMQLRRVCELAGMLEYCDFETQVTVDGGNGRLRPDVVVRLPGNRTIVVDAKVPLGAYLDAIERTNDSERERLVREHARQLKAHMEQLSRKEYWRQFERSPEFVVLFLPGEAFYGAALAGDPSLLESGIGDGVVLAAPSTLMAMLKTVAFAWREERLGRNAEAICAAGRELYERMTVFNEHLDEIGAGLERASEAYRSARSSLERRVMPSARRLGELGVSEPRSQQ